MKTLLHICFCALVGILASCTSGRECRLDSPEGNLGATINSAFDDVAPHLVRGALIYSSSRPLSDMQIDMLRSDMPEAVFRTERRGDNTFAPAEVDVELPLNAYRAGSPAICFYQDLIGPSGRIVFPRSIGSGKAAQVDLFESVLRNGQWSEPQVISGCQSSAWDSQPALSADANVLIFSSDRAGGQGGLDLWLCERTDNGWSAPRNLGREINSAADDITPSLDARNNLYFASNRGAARSRRGFELLQASSQERLVWTAVELLPPPLNSEADDICPVVSNDSIFFASRRKGGCGGYDIYGMQLCGPVIVRGEVLASANLSRRSGVISVQDIDELSSEKRSEKSTDKLTTVAVPDDGRFQLKVWPNRRYTLRYQNDCSDTTIEQEFMTPCNESKSVVLQTKLRLPDQKPVFSLEQFNVPFFSPGYYLPNTTQELNDLRLKFAYNLLGTDESTTYIKTPPKEFNTYAPTVDSAMDSAREFILKVLDFRKRGCNSNAIALTLRVEAYADSKTFAATAKYNGPVIEDKELDVYVKQGEVMTNSLLATLRAYYTIKVLQLRMEKSPLYEEYRRRIIWHIVPKGDDQDATPQSLVRRVDVKVE